MSNVSLIDGHIDYDRMKSVLISIQPKWCELIASGKKTIEVRKTKPKIETPFKVYIYCTKAKMPIWDNGQIVMYEDDLAITNRWGQGKRVENPCGAMMDGELFLNGKVIGEFVCDKVYFRNCDLHDFDTISLEKLSELSCVSEDNLLKYADRGNLYAWHISNLVIYDKPRELSEFKRICDGDCQDCKYAIWQTQGWYHEPKIVDCQPIRPPQSWCYVESEVDTE